MLDTTGIPTWSRCFARCFDTLIITALLFLTISAAGDSLNNGFSDWLAESYRMDVLLFLLQPLVCVIDAFLYSTFGNTIGKAILGFHVSHNNEEMLSFADYTKRNFSVWLMGNGAGLPVLAFAAGIWQYYLLGQTGEASYDTESNYVFTGDCPSLARIVTLVVVTIAAIWLFL